MGEEETEYDQYEQPIRGAASLPNRTMPSSGKPQAGQQVRMFVAAEEQATPAHKPSPGPVPEPRQAWAAGEVPVTHSNSRRGWAAAVLGCIPRTAYLPLCFMVTAGLMMTFVLPLTISYRTQADSTNSAVQLGTFGCSASRTRFLQRHGTVVAGASGLTDTLPLTTRAFPWVAKVSNIEELQQPCAGLTSWLKVTATLSAVSPATGTATMSYTFEPQGNLRFVDGLFNRLNLPDGNISFIADTAETTLTHRMALRQVDFPVNLNPIIPLSSYPFDVYAVNQTIQVSSRLNLSLPHPTQRGVPVQLFFQQAAPLFSLGAEALVVPAASSGDGPSTTLAINVVIGRNNFTFFFSMMILAILWLISGFIFFIALDYVYLRPRNEPPSDIMGVAVGLLFALPGVRQIMPGVPDVGAVIDMACFFWAMLLVAAASILFLMDFLGQYKHKEPLFKDAPDHEPST